VRYDLYVFVGKDQKPPDEIPGAEILGKEQVFAGWWRLTIEVEKGELRSVADWLRSNGFRPAQSPNY